MTGFKGTKAADVETERRKTVVKRNFIVVLYCNNQCEVKRWSDRQSIDFQLVLSDVTDAITS